jgi:hypothetical protein
VRVEDVLVAQLPNALQVYERSEDVGREAAVFEAFDPLGVKLAGDVAKVSACGVIPEGVERHQRFWRR